MVNVQAYILVVVGFEAVAAEPCELWVEEVHRMLVPFQADATCAEIIAKPDWVNRPVVEER